MMFRTAVVLAMCATLYGVFAGDVDLESCRNMFHNKGMKKECCDMDADMGKMIAMEWSEELQKMHDCPHPKPDEPRTCEHAECRLKAMGILVDGKINFADAMKKHHEEFLENNPEIKALSEKIIENCSEENLKELPDHMCTAEKFEVCVTFTALMSCKWKTDVEDCKKIADDTKLCNEALKKAKA